MFAACHVGLHDLVPVTAVTGMGKIARASDLGHYLPLTGREPQLSQTGPAWIVTVHADLPQPGGGGVWNDPACVVIDGQPGWFAVGTITDPSTGIVYPRASDTIAPDRALPSLAP